jgi:alpha-glucoside transport system permease protein
VAADSHLILASTLTQAGSKLLGVVEAVAGFLLILAVVFYFAGRVTGRFQRPVTILICLGPAVVLAIVGLVIPAITTFITSLKNQQAITQPNSKFVGFKNYQYAFTDSATLHTLFRTLLWLLIVPTAAVAVGLLVALLVDRMKHSAVPKTLIFLPTAISFVGAALIWQFVYNSATPPNPQTGILSEVAIKLGWSNPPNWLITIPLNTYLEMVIMVWIQAGFAMVVLGAALKAIPEEILEAARMDGATGVKLFRTVQIPMIRNTIVVVLTTVMIATLKVFDIVFTINNGNFDTDILARKMYADIFVTAQVGRGSALAVLLFLCVLPLVVFNIVQLRKERAR